MFTPAEQRKLIAALDASTRGPLPEYRAYILRRCSQFAIINAEHQTGYAAEQRLAHAKARRIEKLAKRIMREAGDDIGWRAIVKPAEELTKINIRLNGAPRKLGLPFGAVDLAISYLLAEGIRGRDRIEIPKSRNGPFADVLRIVYRVKDPLPIIEEINAYRQREPGPSERRQFGKSRLWQALVEEVAKSNPK